MPYLLWFFVGYVIGSIPFAILIAKARGVDIFKVGSGNPGATNVLRAVGTWEGRMCFFFDALKGFVPVYLAMLYGPALVIEAFTERYAVPCGVLSTDPTFAILALIGAIVGHAYPVWAKFKGGKGVSTTVGGLLALCPSVMLVAMFLWAVVFLLSRYVSLASIVMAVSLPFLAFAFSAGSTTMIVVSLLGALVVVRHKENIKRLLKGTENKFTGKK